MAPALGRRAATPGGGLGERPAPQPQPARGWRACHSVATRGHLVSFWGSRRGQGCPARPPPVAAHLLRRGSLGCRVRGGQESFPHFPGQAHRRGAAAELGRGRCWAKDGPFRRPHGGAGAIHQHHLHRKHSLQMWLQNRLHLSRTSRVSACLPKVALFERPHGHCALTSPCHRSCGAG